MRKILCFSVIWGCLSAALLSGAEAREWTLTDGRSFEAELTGTAEMGGVTYVMLRLSDQGTVRKVKMAKLSQADKDYIKHGGSIGGPAVNLAKPAEPPRPATRQKPANPGDRTKSPTTSAAFAKHIKNDLVRYNGRVLMPTQLRTDPDYYAFYFSAHWCGPCRKFTPELVAFYNAMSKQTDNFEVIFVSSDRSEADMQEYIRSSGMRFPALDYYKRRSATAITRYAGRGIPCLVVVDRRGRVVADSYRGNQYIGPYEPLKKLAALLRQG